MAEVTEAAEEAGATQDYLRQLNDTIGTMQSGDPGKVNLLQDLVTQYDQKFGNIERLLPEVTREFENHRSAFAPFESFVPLMEVDSRDKPLYVAEYLQNQFSFPVGDPQVVRLRELDAVIITLW